MTNLAIYFRHAGVGKLCVSLSAISDQKSRFEALFYFEFGEKYERRAKKTYDALMYHLGELYVVSDCAFRPASLYEAYTVAHKFMSAYKYPTTWHSQFPEFILDPSLMETNLIMPFIEHLKGSTPTYIVTPDPAVIGQILNYLLGPLAFRPHFSNIFVTSDPAYRDYHDHPYITIADELETWAGDLSPGSVWCMFEHARAFPIDTIVILDHKNEYYSETRPFGDLPPHRKIVYISTYVIEHPNFPFRPVYSEDLRAVLCRGSLRLCKFAPGEDVEILDGCETYSLWSPRILDADGKHIDESLAGAGIALSDVIIYRHLPKLGVFVGHVMEALNGGRTKYIVYIGATVPDRRYGFD